MSDRPDVSHHQPHGVPSMTEDCPEDGEGFSFFRDLEWLADELQGGGVPLQAQLPVAHGGGGAGPHPRGTGGVCGRHPPKIDIVLPRSQVITVPLVEGCLRAEDVRKELKHAGKSLAEGRRWLVVGLRRKPAGTFRDDYVPWKSSRTLNISWPNPGRNVNDYIYLPLDRKGSTRPLSESDVKEFRDHAGSSASLRLVWECETCTDVVGNPTDACWDCKLKKNATPGEAPVFFWLLCFVAIHVLRLESDLPFGPQT
jgi:hypothetical protein